ncbi:hypothetical protein PFISCL1PPCAC_3249, partial [Pristionchus fissidentatus]
SLASKSRKTSRMNFHECRLKFVEIFQPGFNQDFAQMESCMKAIFELYRFGPNEHWITADNVTAAERETIVSRFASIDLSNRTLFRHVKSMSESECIRQILSGLVIFRIEIFPEIYQILGFKLNDENEMTFKIGTWELIATKHIEN